MTRRQWKVYWRALRVGRREAQKAWFDFVCFGTAAIMVPNDGSDPYHVPIEELRL